MINNNKILVIICFVILIFCSDICLSQVNISLPDTITGFSGTSIEVPLVTSDMTGLGIISFEFNIRFDSTIYRITEINKTGYIAKDLIFVINTDIKNGLNVGAIGVYPLSGSGTLCTMTFEFTGKGTRLIDWESPIICNDGSPSVTTNNSIVIVSELNNPPLFQTVLPDTVIDENEHLIFNYAATDIDEDNLIFALINPIDGMIVESNGDLSWTPGYDQSGSYEIIVSVSDADTSVIDSANVTVFDVNSPPEFTSTLPDTIAVQDVSLSYTYTAEDMDGDDLIFALMTNIDGMTISDAGDFLWTPTDQQIGDHEIIVSVNDGIIVINDTAYVTVPVNLTFEVKMAVQISYGEFNYSTDTVDIAGSFTEWDNEAISLEDSDNDTIFSVTVPGFIPGETIEYKFRINSDWATAEFHNTDSNRVYEVPGTNSILSHWYNDEDPSVAIDNKEIFPEFCLSQNYPNPFNPITHICYTLPGNSKVKLTIYDILGEKVIELVNSNQVRGFYDVTWDAWDMASGLFFCFIEIKSNTGSGSYSNIKKMMLVK